MKRSLLVCFAVLSLATSTVEARADDASRVDARALGKAGLALFDHGDYAGAYENFRRAYTMYPVPTLGVYTARSLARLGRLVEARDLYARVAAAPFEKNDATFQRAVDDARREGPALTPRIAHLLVRLHAGATAAATASLDDKPAKIGEATDVDPGDHHLLASDGDRHVAASVTLKEGEAREVELTLPESAKPIAPDVFLPPRPRTSPSRTAGWVVVGAGGLGLVAAGGLGIAAVAEQSSFEKKCHGGSCPSSVASDVQTYSTLRTATAVSLYAGAGLAATGLVIVLVSPRHADESSAMKAWIAPTLGGMRAVATF